MRIMHTIMKRRHAPGTAPGTLPAPAAVTRPARARTLTYDASELQVSPLTDPADLQAVPEGGTSWLDVEGPEVGFIAELGDRLRLHPLALEDVLNVGQRPKVEQYEDSLFVVLDSFTLGEDRDLRKEQISIVLQPGLVLSIRELTGDLFDPVHQRLLGGRGRIRGGGAGYLAYALIDTVVDHYFPVLEAIGDQLEELDASILDDPTPDDLGSLHDVKRKLMVLRKSTWPLRDLLRSRALLEAPQFDAETLVFLRDAADHAAVVFDIVETYREMVASLSDLYLTNVSLRANDIMKVLTIIASIFIPLSFIAGLYGMNFDTRASPWNMPELGWYWGYPAVLTLMALIAGGLLLFIWRRRWL